MQFGNHTDFPLNVPAHGVTVDPGHAIDVTADEALGFVWQTDVWFPADAEAAAFASEHLTGPDGRPITVEPSPPIAVDKQPEEQA